MITSREKASGIYDADLETSIGTFRLRISKINYPNTYDTIITLNIGGKDDCASFTIPMYKKEPIKLSYARASENRFQCTLDDKEIKGETTFKMMCLALGIIGEITDQTFVELEDMSHFTCLLPSGEKREIPLSPFSFVFYGQTWYEKKFGAMLVDVGKRTAYMNMKCRLSNPSYKPATYDFRGNKSLQDMLQPLFEKTTTWEEFFGIISETYGKNKCHIVYPWLDDVLRKYIFKNNFVFMGDKWIFNFAGIPKLPYTIKHVYSDGAQIGGSSDGYNSSIELFDRDIVREFEPPAYIATQNYHVFSNKRRKTRRAPRRKQN